MHQQAQQSHANEIDIAFQQSDVSKGGGQIYAANLFGGVGLRSGVISYTNLFGSSVNDNSNPIAKLVTNLDNPGKMGNSEAFWVYQYAVRIQKISAAAMTSAVAQDIVRFLSSVRLQFFVASNRIRVLDLSGLHFGNVLNAIVSDASTLGSNSISLPVNQSSWISLPGQTVQKLPPNENFNATLDCNLVGGTPSSLDSTPASNPDFVFNFVMAGKRFTR